ncbi:MAG: cardiolipin synthase [Clostridia bacterium]|nr:cardiolipin synthase [Clostridia bacterium]
MDYIINNLVFFINILLVISMIFLERKKPEVIVSWTILFAFLPLVGFVLYILIGGGLSFKNRRMLKAKHFYDDKFQSFYREIEEGGDIIRNRKISNLIRFNILNAKSVPTFGNKIEIFNDGKDKIDSLITDIKDAKHSINLEYYIFDDDFVGKEIMNLLCEKAKSGIKVKLIYDSVGCLGAPRRFFNKLKKAGGEVREFFPPLFNIRMINLKMNYRDHRKIAVIDGKIGYVGGINIRKDHLGYSKKLSPWRDTHLKIKGQAVYALQNTFFNFWQFCAKQDRETKEYVKEGYFPKIKSQGNVISQIVTSGPDDSKNNIKEAMIKMINSAHNSIFLQTPYFVPDEIFMNSIKQAIKSGVKVTLMLPKIPDKKFVYMASLSFAKEIIETGGQVFFYKGFLHSKVLIIDETAMCIGTCNADYRSFSLNFEITAILYQKDLIKKHIADIEKDLQGSMSVDLEYYKKRPLFSKFGQVIFRLFAPLL